MLVAKRLIQFVRYFLLASIVLYGYIVWHLPASAVPNPLLLRILTAVSVSLVVMILVVRRR